MMYFSYGTDLSVDAVLDYCRAHKLPVPRRMKVRPAVMANYRIQFSRYDTFFGGGVAGAVAETGKSVSGALMELSEKGLETLRKLSGIAVATSVKVTPLQGGPPIDAFTFIDGGDQIHMPPTSAYLNRLVAAAVDLGLSMMWVMQLQTFPIVDLARPRSSLRLELPTEMQTTAARRHEDRHGAEVRKVTPRPADRRRAAPLQLAHSL